MAAPATIGPSNPTLLGGMVNSMSVLMGLTGALHEVIPQRPVPRGSKLRLSHSGSSPGSPMDFAFRLQNPIDFSIRFQAERLTDLRELNDIDSAFPSFVLCNKRLRLAECTGETLLGYVRPDARGE